MKFIANENFPQPSLNLLEERGVDIISIAKISPGITDHEVMELAANENRTILTLDSDYGELIFKYGYKNEAGVVYFRLMNSTPMDPAISLLELIDSSRSFSRRFTVVSQNSIRERLY